MRFEKKTGGEGEPEVVDWEGETHESDGDQEEELSEDIEVIINLQSLQHDDHTGAGESSLGFGIHL